MNDVFFHLSIILHSFICVYFHFVFYFVFGGLPLRKDYLFLICLIVITLLLPFFAGQLLLSTPIKYRLNMLLIALAIILLVVFYFIEELVLLLLHFESSVLHRLITEAWGWCSLSKRHLSFVFLVKNICFS